MADQIILYSVGGASITTINGSNSVTLSCNNGIPRYQNPTTGAYTDVGLAEANLDSSTLVMTLTNTSGNTVNGIRVTTTSSTSISSHLEWTSGATSVLTFERPGVSGQTVDWEIGDGVPPIKVKVKIKRN